MRLGEARRRFLSAGAHSERSSQRAVSTGTASLYAERRRRESRSHQWTRRRKLRDWRIPVAWLTLCVVWSSTWLVIKIGLRDLPPVSFVALRFVVAILVLLAISIGRARLLPRSRADYLVLAGTGLLMFGLNYTLLFWAELHVSSGLAAVIQASIPIFGMIFAHWMLPDEPLRWQRLFGALVAMARRRPHLCAVAKLQRLARFSRRSRRSRLARRARHFPTSC